MKKMDLNHCQRVKDVITGQRMADEQSFASLSVLEDRLNRVRKFGGRFSRIGFSSEVKHFSKQKDLVAV